MGSNYITARQANSIPHDAKWIFKLQDFARHGSLQAGSILLVVLWTLAHTLCRSRSHVWIRASQQSLPYELASQITRSFSFALIILSTIHDEQQWANVALIGYAFLSGVISSLGNKRLRQLLLYPANLLVFISLIILIASEVLPLAVAAVPYELNQWILGTILALTGSVLVALAAPRARNLPAQSHNSSLHIAKLEASREEICSSFSYYFSFDYVTPLIWKGFRAAVEMVDLPVLPWYDKPLQLMPDVFRARRKSDQKTLLTLLRYQMRNLAAMAAWITAAFSLELVSPYALYHLLNYLNDPNHSIFHPALWLCLMFVGIMSRTVCYQQYLFNSSKFLVRVQAGFTQELYHRAITSMELEEAVINGPGYGKQNNGANRSSANGHLANLMSSDVAAVCQARDAVMILTGIPVGTILTVVGLYNVIGWPAIIGTVFMIALTPLPAYIAQIMGNVQRKVKIAQDARISLITEYLPSIKAIKCFAWEEAMVSRIQKVRGEEQRDLWRITMLLITMAEIGDLIPVSALAFMFVMYTAVLGRPLTASVAFTTLALFSTIRRNINWFNFYSRSAVNSWVSMQRLDRYFKNTSPLVSYPVGPLALRNATFRRNRSATLALEDITLEFVEGGLNVVSGLSGSGKTTLLLAILGETILERGSVTCPSDVAFVSQTPWLQSETVRDNIVFNSEFEQLRYDRVIQACDLEIDISELPFGDSTKVGENGSALSGGQKARVAFARALYSKAPLLLLDDTFSALDTKTAAAIWKNCFCTDLLDGRTTILVTQLPWIQAQADLSIVLDNGQVKFVEKNPAATRTPIIIEQADQEDNDNKTKPTDPDETLPGTSGLPKLSDTALDDVSGEMQATGKVNRFSFHKYMLYFGGSGYVLLAIITTLLVNIIFVGTTYWLSLWVNAYGKQEAVSIAFYLGIYLAFTLGSVLLDAISFLTYANGAWKAASSLHEACISSVMNTSLGWWKNVPVGRVVNRLSRDIASLDNTLPHSVQVFIETAMKIFFRLGAISSILPIFVVPGLVSCFLGVLAGEMYSRTAVVIRRLVSASRSPVFSHFNDSMAGLAVIRARNGMSEVFSEKMAAKLSEFSRAQQASANLNRWVAVRIDLITAFVSLCAGIIAVAKAGQVTAGLVGFSLTNALGLSDTILMVVRSMSDLEVEMQSFHRLHEYADVEPEDKSDDLYRGDTMATENGSVHPQDAVPVKWPTSGSIELRNVTVKYDENGPEVLKDISIKFGAGERVAIVGRTGSGKSTLVLTLLRFTHIAQGDVFYDGVNIKTIPRKKLRESLTVIPQEPTLFSGTVGSNLDPWGKVLVDQLQEAVDLCTGIGSFGLQTSDIMSEHLKQRHKEVDQEESHTPTEDTPLLPGSENVSAYNRNMQTSNLSLDGVVRAKGENFSHGQRQVISLCRAIVRHSKLMLLDEATASMDYETDQKIQDILRANLENLKEERRTLITIAHRLRTVADYDKVVVLGGGRVLEFGPPGELYRNRGHFFDMVQHSGDREEVESILKGDSS
ncbi:ABC transporter [Nemania sp. FL0916]|nr:ABC transporter [Nemania sp. FL0916]